MRALVKFNTLLMPYNMKSAENQTRKPTTAAILIPVFFVGEPAQLLIAGVTSALYDSAPRPTAQSAARRVRASHIPPTTLSTGEH
jgi:hypothetical protein